MCVLVFSVTNLAFFSFFLPFSIVKNIEKLYNCGKKLTFPEVFQELNSNILGGLYAFNPLARKKLLRNSTFYVKMVGA